MSNKLIIIGNGESVLNKKNGSYIDDFDVVIRCNECIIKGYEDYVGTKTDILSVASKGILVKIIEGVGKTSNDTYINDVSTIWFTRPFYEKYYDSQNKYPNDKLLKTKGIENIKVINNSTFNDIHKGKDKNTYLSTGIVTILMAIEYYSDYDIYIMGFDGFKSGHYFKDNLKDIGDRHNKKDESLFLGELIKKHKIKII